MDKYITVDMGGSYRNCPGSLKNPVPHKCKCGAEVYHADVNLIKDEDMDSDKEFVTKNKLTVTRVDGSKFKNHWPDCPERDYYRNK